MTLHLFTIDNDKCDTIHSNIK